LTKPTTTGVRLWLAGFDGPKAVCAVPPLVVVLLPELVDFDEEPQDAMATAAIARTATLMVLLDAIVTMICPLR
jgi:hypothetical protein